MSEELTIRKEIRLPVDTNMELGRRSAEKKISQAAIIREALELLFDQWAAFDERGQGTE